MFETSLVSFKARSGSPTIEKMCRATEFLFSCGCPQNYTAFAPCEQNCRIVKSADKTRRFGPEPCALHSNPAYQPGTIEALHAGGLSLPRFLFRGFHGTSNATHAGFNSEIGVYPWAYPLGKAPPPVSQYDYTHILGAADHHVNFGMEPPSDLTSWTADLSTAIWFATGSYHHTEWQISSAKGYLCVLDVAAWLPLEERPRHIFHAPRVGYRELPMEYLVYGHVTGPAYRCVSLPAIRQALGCERFPFCPVPPRTPHQPPPSEVRDALNVGSLFQLPTDTEADLTLAVAAGILAWTQRDVASPEPLTEAQIASELYRPATADELWDRQSLTAIGDQIFPSVLPRLSRNALVNAMMDTTASPQLKLCGHLLVALRNIWKDRSVSIVARQTWQDSLPAIPGPAHACPRIRRCDVCDKAEGEPGVELTVCAPDCDTLYCSGQCRVEDRSMHFFVCKRK